MFATITLATVSTIFDFQKGENTTDERGKRSPQQDTKATV
jgi:hypothetical protein